MEFSPFNPVIKLCLQGMGMEEKANTEEALKLFHQAWREASSDFERFIAAHYIARNQKAVNEQLKWLELSLQNALKTNDDAVKSAFPLLYSNLAKCYKELGLNDKAQEHAELSLSFKNNPADKGPFYHGTKAVLQIGDMLIAGGNSNYQSDLKMNHIYFTALINGAGLAASLAKGDGLEHVYIIEPTGEFENDPNVTDKKFPGNPTRSYRSLSPLKIVGEASDWAKPSAEELQKWREKLEGNKGEIIN